MQRPQKSCTGHLDNCVPRLHLKLEMTRRGEPLSMCYKLAEVVRKQSKGCTGSGMSPILGPSMCGHVKKVCRPQLA